MKTRIDGLRQGRTGLYVIETKLRLTHIAC